MKIEQTILSKTFVILHQEKEYLVNYTNSDEQTPNLLNRNLWEVKDEDGEELNIYPLGKISKKKKVEIEENRRLVIKLIKFCIKHIHDYKPDTEINSNNNY